MRKVPLRHSADGGGDLLWLQVTRMVKPLQVADLTKTLTEAPTSILFEHLDETGEMPAYGKIACIHPGSAHPSNILVALPRVPITYVDFESAGTNRVSVQVNDELFAFLDALYRAAGFAPNGLDKQRTANIRLRLKYYGRESIIVPEGATDDTKENRIPVQEMEVGGYLRACVNLSTCAYQSPDGVKKSVLFSVYKAYYVPPPVNSVTRKRSRIEF